MEGLTGITLCATLKVLVPNQDDCDQLALLLGSCEPAKPWQMTYLYTALYVTGFGAAGIRPCVSSFGADQFDERDRNYKQHLDRFFNFFYLSVTVGAIVAFTAIVYIQIQHGWGSAFGSLAAAMGLSNVVFFVGTPLYRHRLPGGSPLTRVAQVLVAAFRKRNVPWDKSEFVGLYELPGKRSAVKGSNKIPHTDDFSIAAEGRRNQSKSMAALHRNPSGRSENPDKADPSSGVHHNANANPDGSCHFQGSHVFISIDGQQLLVLLHHHLCHFLFSQLNSIHESSAFTVISKLQINRIQHFHQLLYEFNPLRRNSHVEKCFPSFGNLLTSIV
nr:protein NRT1/ PTR FAMILY 6.1 [Ipomoea batatas]